jgi:hypothetical protein
MELKNDSELRDLLREWTVPGAPASLEARVLRTPQRWWRVLIFGYLQVPVPVACGLVILMAIGAWRLSNPASAGCSPSATPTAAAVPRVPHSSSAEGCTFDSSC